MYDKIGVITPVYKVEKYIAECIESILAQTYTNFRLILVDDGTPDKSGKICDEYAKKDPRITVIHQENAGVTCARKRGFEEANDCEFITFVDSDDTIAEDALESLYSEIKNNETDIVVGHFEPFTDIGTDLITIDDYRTYLIKEQYIAPGLLGKLYRKTLFDKLTFDITRELVIAEDVIMNLRLSFNTSKAVKFHRKGTYNYRIYQGSTYQSHIRTPENEQLIQSYRISSIPPDKIDKYIGATIEIRLLRFREFWGYMYCVKNMKNTEFYKQLLSDINKYNYKMSHIDTIIFNNSCPIVRFIAINTKKLINLLFCSKETTNTQVC